MRRPRNPRLLHRSTTATSCLRRLSARSGCRASSGNSRESVRRNLRAVSQRGREIRPGARCMIESPERPGCHSIRPGTIPVADVKITGNIQTCAMHKEAGGLPLNFVPSQPAVVRPPDRCRGSCGKCNHDRHRRSIFRRHAPDRSDSCERQSGDARPSGAAVLAFPKSIAEAAQPQSV